MMTLRQLTILLLASLSVATPVGHISWAQMIPAPGIPGVLGTIEAVTDRSIDIRTKTGLVRVSIEQPLRTYHEVPSELSRVAPGSYVGVPSVTQQDGRELAQKIYIFPNDLRGAAEGSVLTDSAAGDTVHSRMTNGSVSRAAASRMTNGSVQKSGTTTLVVTYQEGSKTISVPPHVPVTEFVPGQVTLAKGDTVYVATTRDSDGKATTNRIVVVAPPKPAGK